MNIEMSFIFYINLTFVLALLTPGPNFVVIESNTINNGRKAGLFSALGIWLGSNLWLLICHYGFSFVFKNESIKLGISIFGAFYLYFLGFKILKDSKLISKNTIFEINNSEKKKNKKFFTEGFASCLVNPEIIAFYSAIFIQIAEYNELNDTWFKNYYLLILSLLILITFSSLAIASSLLIKKIKKDGERIFKIINIIFSGFLFINAIKMTVDIFKIL